MIGALGDENIKDTANPYSDNIDKLVELHGGLVKSVALRLSRIYNEDLEDLIQIGYIGLIKAVKGFDSSKGLAFSTYAVPTIAGEIRSQLRDQGTIKVSRELKAAAYKVRRAEDEYIAAHGVSPKISELAKETGFTREKVVEAMQASDAMTHFEDYEQAELWSSEEEKYVDNMDLMNSIEALPPKERQVILLRYFKDYTQKQVAKIMNVSQVQVCRIEKSGLQWLNRTVKE